MAAGVSDRLDLSDDRSNPKDSRALLVEEQPPGYRLLVTLAGHVAPGYEPFSGPDWATVRNDKG